MAPDSVASSVLPAAITRSRFRSAFKHGSWTIAGSLIHLRTRSFLHNFRKDREGRLGIGFDGLEPALFVNQLSRTHLG